MNVIQKFIQNIIQKILRGEFHVGDPGMDERMSLKWYLSV
jgi:hypothetical protein